MTNFKNRMDAAKWVLPLILAAGYFLTFKYFQWYESHPARYFVSTALLLGSCALLLTQVNLFEQRFIAVWFVVLLFIVVYFTRFYWITIDASPVHVMLPHNPWLHMVERRDQLLQAFELSVVAFAAFSVSAAGLLFLAGVKSSAVTQNAVPTAQVIDSGVIQWMLWLVVPLMLALAYISYVFHIGEMGAAPGAVLPFRLSGVIFYARTVFIPLTLLLAIYLLERDGRIFTSRLTILFLILHGVMDMLLRNSRSSLLLALLLLLFLMIVGGLKIRRSEKMLGSVMFGVGIIMVPLMTQYRSMRVQHDMSYVDAFSSAVAALGGDWFGQIFAGMKFVLFRMPGIESLWCMLSWNAKPLGASAIEVLASKSGIAGYLTYDIYNFLESDHTLLAPGFVGWFYLVGGFPMVVLGSILTGAIAVTGWKYLEIGFIQCAPIAKVFFLWILFLALTEGTLDSMVHMLMVGAISLVGLELCLRLVSRRKGLKTHRGN